jgi:hypothetical protein
MLAAARVSAEDTPESEDGDERILVVHIWNRSYRYADDYAPAVEKQKGPPTMSEGLFEVKRQNGAWSLMSDDSTVASGPDAGACGSGSPRSSLRTTSARIDHEVIFAVLAFLPLPFACS